MIIYILLATIFILSPVAIMSLISIYFLEIEEEKELAKEEKKLATELSNLTEEIIIDLSEAIIQARGGERR